jgi:hypothetical protein
MTETITINDIKNMSFDVMQKNQYVFNLKDCKMFYSYKSIIAIKYDNGDVLLDSDLWDYSRTTGKYRNIFLDEDKKTTEKKIKKGEYKLKKLN